MSWINVKLIFLRELRDQLRDRRTLFTIAVLPLLLYPLLGMTFLQITQFLREHPTRVLILNADALPAEPPLLDKQQKRFHVAICYEAEGKLLQLTVGELPEKESVEEFARRKVEGGEFDTVVYVPAGFAEHLTEFRQRVQRDDAALETTADGTRVESLESEVPQPEIYVNTASDKSRIAFERIDRIVDRWREKMVEEHLRQNNVSIAATRPFKMQVKELAPEGQRRAVLWSKILPFVVLVWALTGAFYPAVDLCAGEKERGTLETLLTSPAQRIEIVTGKLMTVMTFSMATSLLNLVSMGMTGTFILTRITSLQGMPDPGELGPPPLSAFFWLTLALIPCSALFSALSLAIATFARSSKEGQYYLMPLLLGSLPLMLLPMLPSAQLDLGTSLIPITGVLLLLRTLIEGQVWEAAKFALPVIVVQAAGVWLAVRWAVHQFNDESVLFRESERFDVRLWFVHLLRDRRDTPSIAEAVLCGVLLLMIRFFGSMVATMPETWQGFVSLSLITQIAFFATPPCLMAIMLTRKPLLTLSLGRPSFWMTIPAAGLLALALQPLTRLLQTVVVQLYPYSEATLESLAPLEMILRDAPLGWTLLAMAVAPAICEELAFRGFILSGLRRLGHKWGAIALTAVFFGIAHGILQQSILATITGLVLGYICVKTSSIWPAMTYHLVHNATAISAARLTPATLEHYPFLRYLLQPGEVVGGEVAVLDFTWLAVGIGTALALGIILWLKSLPYRVFEEERLQEAIDRQDHPMEYVSSL